MKKSNFVALLLGTISLVFFGIGMCMTMLPAWGAFRPGVAVGCVGLLFALITLIVWRKMENKEPIHVTGKTILAVLLGIVGALTLGVGMCLVMVWNRLLVGIGVGLIGIFLLLFLIPLCKGLN